MERVSDRELQQALDRFRRTGDGLGKCLIELGWPDEDTALHALAGTLGIRFVDLSEVEIERSAAAGISPELIQKARVIPLSQADGHLVLAMENPFDFQTADHLRILLGKEVERVICRASDMAAAMQKHYGWNVSCLEFRGLGRSSGTFRWRGWRGFWARSFRAAFRLWMP